MQHYSRRAWGLPTFRSEAAEKKGEGRRLSDHHGNTALEIASPTPRQKQSAIILPL